MRIPRVFYPLSNIELGTVHALDATLSHYLLNVLRMKTGDALLCCAGNNWVYPSVISSIVKKQVVITLLSAEYKSVESPLTLHLGQVISKGDRMEYSIQKAIELGVQTITPLFSERCVVSLNAERLSKKIQHWQLIANSASEQCGRNMLTPIHEPETLSTWVEKNQAQTALVLNPTANATLKSITIESNVNILIGAEGGLTTNEIALAEKNKFISVQLGPRILRTETAPLAIITALQVLKGDLA